MKTVVYSILAALFVLSAAAFKDCCSAATPATSAALAVVDPPLSTQIVIGQNTITETVTCAAAFAHYDRRQYGAIETTTCTTTGALSAANGNTGNVTVTLDLPGGALVLKGCSVDATATGWTLVDGFVQIDVNCTH
jgi:hypothetical protein